MYLFVYVYIYIFIERGREIHTPCRIWMERLLGHTQIIYTWIQRRLASVTANCQASLKNMKFGGKKSFMWQKLIETNPKLKNMYVYIYNIYIYYFYISIHRCMFIRMWRQSISLFSRQPLRSPLKGARTKFHTVLTKHELSSWGYPNSWMGKNWKFLLSINDGPGYPPMTMETSIWENIPY
jgi:hypothetical protein